jgi:hypothetical protein
MFLRVFTVSELDAATNGFAASRFIGAGGCGRVYRGVLASGENVAVKRWSGGTSQPADSLTELMNELHTLGQISHRNLLPVLGFVCQPPDLMLVTPHMARGSLHDALHGTDGAAARFDAACRVSFLLDMALGVQSLHAANIVHRDVKSANVLIGDDGRALLADAGVARRLRADADDVAAATGTRIMGTDGYLDPEYQHTSALSYKSDVFSVGVVILEMLTGKPARDPSAVPPLLWGRFRSVSRADDLDQRVRRLASEAAECWSGDAALAGVTIMLASLALQATAESSESRPSVVGMIASLEAMQREGGEVEDDEDVRMCMVCFAKPRSLRFDCGHMTTCEECVARWPHCLVCNHSTGVDLNLEANPRDPTYMVSPPLRNAPPGANDVQTPATEPDELSAYLVALRLGAQAVDLRAFGVVTPEDLADVEDAELLEMGIKPLKMRQLRRASCAMVGGGGEEALAPFLAELRLVDFEVNLRDLGVATPDDLADVEDAELFEMGVKPITIRHLRRVLCALVDGGDGGDEQGADELGPFLAELRMDDCAVKLREIGVATPDDLSEMEDAELVALGARPLKVRQLRKALASSDKGILRLWRDQCPALRNLTIYHAVEKIQAGTTGTVEVMAAAMRAYAGSAVVQDQACLALQSLTITDEENRTRAGAAGAVEAVVAAMRAHAGSVGVQEQACLALRNLTNDHAENSTQAGTAGAVEAVVAAMRAHAGSVGVQEQACLALRNLTGNHAENSTRAGAAGAIEAVVAAMRTHAGSVGVQEQACFALRNLTINKENMTRAGTAGAVEAVAATMHMHAGSAGVQEQACTALLSLTCNHAENKTRARDAGAKELAEAALKAHSGNEKVGEQARWILVFIT